MKENNENSYDVELERANLKEDLLKEETTINNDEQADMSEEVEGENETESMAELKVEPKMESEPEVEPKMETTNQVNDKPRKTGSFWQSLLAGVIGAVLTLVVVMNVPMLQEKFIPQNESPQTAETVSPVDVEQVSSSDDSLIEMVESASKAIVGVVNYKEAKNPLQQTPNGNAQGGTGSGVIFSKEDDTAYVVTNNHVIENAKEIEVSLENGETVEAELIGTDALSDIAVLKISAEHVEAVLDFGDSEVLKAGEQVIAIGNPLGLEFSRTVTQGIVSGVDRSINVQTSAGEWALDVLQTDAAINPGNSGGALLNMQGQVIGINSLKISSNQVEGLGFAIPSNDVIPLVNEIIKNGEIERPYLGVSMVELAQVPRTYLKDLPNEVTDGVVVTNVDPESAAAKAGIEVEDIITEVDGKEIKNPHDLRKVLYTDLKVGETINLQVYKENQAKTVEVTLTSNQQLNEEASK